MQTPVPQPVSGLVQHLRDVLRGRPSGLGRGLGQVLDRLLEEVGIVAATRFEDELAGRRALPCLVQTMHRGIYSFPYIFVRHRGLVVRVVLAG